MQYHDALFRVFFLQSRKPFFQLVKTSHNSRAFLRIRTEGVYQGLRLHFDRLVGDSMPGVHIVDRDAGVIQRFSVGFLGGIPHYHQIRFQRHHCFNVKVGIHGSVEFFSRCVQIFRPYGDAPFRNGDHLHTQLV